MANPPPGGEAARTAPTGSPLQDRARRTRRPRPSPLRSAIEALEVRSLLSGGPVPSAFLHPPIPEGTPLAEHIHPHLTILVHGQPQAIPAGIGIGPNGNLPLHTHDASGTIHVESTARHTFRLRDFFTIWGQPFNRRDILGHVADAKHHITMTVEGLPSRAFETLPVRDGQEIVIHYDPAPVRSPHSPRG